MLTRPLGKTGLTVPLLGLGTVKFGRTAKVSYPRPYVLPSDGQVADLLALAKSLDVTLLDTAPAYGTSEQRIGEAIAGERTDWLLCSKAGEEFGSAGSRYDFNEEYVLRSVERSLERLRTDYLDILLLHADGRDTQRIVAAGAFRALRRLQGEGVVRAVGFSGKGEADGCAALPLADVLMCTANATCDSQASLIARAGEESVGVLVKKPLASGHQATPQALKKLGQMPGVSCIVVGTIDADHLAANVASLVEGSASASP